MVKQQYNTYSVLMSVYYREKATYLKEAIESIQMQSFPTNDFVLVCDGKLTPELDRVIKDKENEMGTILNVIRLDENGGLGNALNVGIQHCKNELVARMDSDDISYPNRCQLQLDVFNACPMLAICSGIVEEFSESINFTEIKKVPPETQQEIIRYAKRRNPFNHPCVMYKKSAVIASGSYQPFYLLEDYYLWIRMLMAGFQGYNLQYSLLHMRAGKDMYKRRGGLSYVKSQLLLFKYMRDNGFINYHAYIENCFIRSIVSLVPNDIRMYFFRHMLRK